MKTLKVNLAQRSYPIMIGTGLLNRIGELVKQHGTASKYIIVTNDVVDKIYGESVQLSFERAKLNCNKIIVPDGERFKTLETFENIISEMLQLGYDRRSTIIALGGGVIGDLAGYVAAAYMRGIDFIQVPTTLLAQVDASVGGKVAVNHRLGKNMIGAFHQPRLVIIDPDTLATLPRREIICGLGEVIKHALIYDAEYFQNIQINFDRLLSFDEQLFSEIILRSCEIKAEIVAQDERESGVRGLLNFGHTIGHALEAVSHYGCLHHGEAVIIGMLAEAFISRESQKLSEQEFHRIDNFLRTIPLSADLAGIPMEDIEKFTSRDKKVIDGTVRMVLLDSIGHAELTSTWNSASLRRALQYALSAFGRSGF